jgi:hypothetical protein
MAAAFDNIEAEIAQQLLHTRFVAAVLKMPGNPSSQPYAGCVRSNKPV